MHYPRVLTLIPVLLCLIISTLVIRQCDSVNILVLEGVPSPSHHLWMRTLTTELALHGHNVTSLSCDVEDSPPTNLTYLHLDQIYTTMYGDYEQNGTPADVFAYSQLGTWTKLMISSFWSGGMFRGSVKSKGFQELLDYPDDFPFDLIIYDTITSAAMMAFLDKFEKSPVISVTPFPLIYPLNHITGALYMPSFVPNQNLVKLETSCFLGRLNNFLLTAVEHCYLSYLSDSYEKQLSQRVPLKRSFKELYARTRLIMPNYSPAINLVQPIMPMVVPVGGLQIKDTKPLPDDLEVLFQSAQRGVIYFSLGTNIQSEQLGARRLTELIEAFRALPEYTFLWKIDVTGLELDLPSNVHVRKFFPQHDILAHNKTLLFISHGGGLSTQETIWFAVPLLGVPVFLDQHPNVNLAVDAGTAINFNLKDIERNKFKEAILEMITNPSYRNNAQVRSRNFRDQKEHPLERAMWWIDYILRNPDVSFLQHATLNQMNVFIKHSMDIVAFLTIVTIALFYVFYKFIQWIIRKRRMTKRKSNDGKKSQ